jgi:hypothetical protein
MVERALTTRDCLRNALRRTGREVPPAAEAIAAPLTDDELQELIIGLHAILLERRHAA